MSDEAERTVHLDKPIADKKDCVTIYVMGNGYHISPAAMMRHIPQEQILVARSFEELTDLLKDELALPSRLRKQEQ